MSERNIHRGGDTLDNRYRILRVLGGDFGMVYMVEDIPGTREVAVKQLPEQMIVNCEWQADMRPTLAHPAIPRIYECFTENEYAYLVSEYIPGENLETALDKTKGFFPEARVVKWAIELCDVLNYLHTHPYYPMVFRDLKPNNLVLDEQDYVHLVDFELAKIFPPGYLQNPTPEFAHFEQGLKIGTEGYSPPEQYRGHVAGQSDLYALGATLHHLVTRRDPRNESAHTFQDFPVRSLNPNISVALESIIMKALEIEIGRRYVSAEAMKIALEALQR